ncbi:MAG: hypothetical protein M0Z59_09270 [Nitrospiraceae bacterium]|nr:hypothetical protein [Nitrospiraceae bacterium]
MGKVVAYRNTGTHCFFQMKLKNKERILVSVANNPVPGIKILKLVLGGLIPAGTVWEFDRDSAGGGHSYEKRLDELFPARREKSMHILDAVMVRLSSCRSTLEIRHILG